jgi:hypothetical protein
MSSSEPPKKKKNSTSTLLFYFFLFLFQQQLLPHTKKNKVRSAVRRATPVRRVGGFGEGGGALATQVEPDPKMD